MPREIVQVNPVLATPVFLLEMLPLVPDPLPAPRLPPALNLRRAGKSPACAESASAGRQTNSKLKILDILNLAH